MKTIKSVLITFLITLQVNAQSDEMKQGTWQIGFTFGEIPVLSGSFKPGITLGYYLHKSTMLEFTYQFKDYLNRDEESFNATSIGFDGLISSNEVTGERIFLGIRYQPVEDYPYLSAGFVWNMQDSETIIFDKRSRIIGSGEYNTEIEMVQRRESGFAPAIGVGYQYNFDNRVSLNTSFAMAFFSQIPTPVNEIKSRILLSNEDKASLNKKINKAYLDNFHNRYHIFNLGVIYRFE